MIDGAGALADLLPDHPADERRADHHPGHPHLHHRLERLLLAAAGRHQRGVQGAHRRARGLQVPDAARQPGLGRPDGGHPGRRAAAAASCSSSSGRRSSTPSASPASSSPAPQHRDQPGLACPALTTARHERLQGRKSPDMARLRRRLGVGTGAALACLTACGGGGDGGDRSGRRRRRQRPARSTTGCGTPTSCPPTRVRRRVQHQPTRTHSQDQPVRLGRLLEKLTNGFVAGDRARRVHQPPVQVPGVRHQRAAGAAGRPLDEGRLRLDHYQEGLADLWNGQDGKRYGLPKDFDTVAIFYNKKLADGRRLPPSRPAGPDLEPDRRRHLREDDRPPDRRRERRARRRAGLRQERRSRSTASAWTAAPAAASARPSGACTPEPLAGQHHRQEPVGHPLQLRQPRVPEDHRLVGSA